MWRLPDGWIPEKTRGFMDYFFLVDVFCRTSTTILAASKVSAVAIWALARN